MQNNETQKDEPVEFEDAVSKTEFGWYNITLLVVCGLSLMSVIMETLSMSYVVPAAKCELDLSLFEKGLLSSIGFLGVVSSSLLWGFIGDTVGRRKLVLISSYISFLAGIASSLIPYVWLLILFRFVNCFFIGGPSAAVIAFLGEFHGFRYRARIIAFSATFVAGASIIMPSLAWLVLPMEWAIPVPIFGIVWRPWRLLIILYGLPSFLSATWLLFLPESPKYLWSIGDYEQALAVLRNIYAWNTKANKDTYPVTRLVISNENTKYNEGEAANLKSKNIFARVFKLISVQIFPIFRPPLLVRTFHTALLLFGVFAASTGLLMWLPEILNRVSAYSERFNSSVTICEAMEFKQLTNETNVEIEVDYCVDKYNTDVFTISIIIGFASAATFIFIGTFINYFGKKRLLAGLLFFSGISGLITNFMGSYLLISIFSGLFVIGGAGVTILNTAVVDLFPTQYRSIAMSVCLMVGRIGAMVATNSLGYLLEYSCITTYFLLGGELIVLAAIALLLPTN